MQFKPYRKDPNWKPPTPREKIHAAKDAAEHCLHFISKIEQVNPKLATEFKQFENKLKEIQWDSLDELVKELGTK